MKGLQRKVCSNHGDLHPISIQGCIFIQRMVHFRDDVIGLDSSIVTTPSVHQASGHVSWKPGKVVGWTKR